LDLHGCSHVKEYVYVEKTVANEPDEGLANFLASMGLEFTRVMLQKGFFSCRPCMMQTGQERFT